MKYCENCGHEIDKEKYCGYCGYKHKKKHKKAVIIIVAVICCVSIIFVSVFGVLKFVDKDTATYICSDYIFFTEGFTDVKITDEKSAIEAVASVSDLLGITDAEKELKVKSVNTIDGDNFYRMQQYYNDIPVYGKTIVVASDKSGNATALTSNYNKIPDDFSTTPNINLEKAADIAAKYLNIENDTQCYVCGTDLVIYETESNNIVLSFVVTLNSTEIVIVDATSAKVLQYNSSVNDFSAEVQSHDGEIRSIGWQNDDGSYHLYNEDYKIEVFDVKDINTAVNEKGSVYGDFKLYGIDTMYSENNKFDKDAVRLLNDTINIVNYYDSLEFDGFDQIHIAINDSYDNGGNARGGGGSDEGIDLAFMLFGSEFDADNEIITAHEFTHGVTSLIVDWDKSSIENKALNEAFSDIFGVLCSNVNAPDWSMQGIKNQGIRNLENPSAANSFDHMSDIIESDGYDFYTLSTIVSHSAYLMWNGVDGSDNRKIDGALLSKLWYRAMLLLPSGANFSQCRNVVELSARIMQKNDKLTKEQYKTVVTAFDTVGIEKSNYTYSSTVKNKFDLSVLSVEGTENVSYKLEVIKSITKPGPDESERIMEKTSLQGKQSLDLENGVYIIHITDVDDTDNISQTISMMIVVDGNNSKATDEVVVHTDFTDLITVVLDEDEESNGSTDTQLSNTQFKHDRYLVEFDDAVYYVDQNGLWKNTGSEESELLYDCKATNIASNGEVIYYSVYNSDTTAFCESYGEDSTWKQYDMYCYDLRTSKNSKITSFIEQGKPICVYNNKLYYTDCPDDFTGDFVGMSHHLFSFDLSTGEKEFISEGASNLVTYGSTIFFRDMDPAFGDSEIKRYDIENGNIETISSEYAIDFSISGDNLFYTEKDYTYSGDDSGFNKPKVTVTKYNIPDKTTEVIFDEIDKDINIQYVDNDFIFYTKGNPRYNYRINLATGEKTSINSSRWADEYVHSVFKLDDAALYYHNTYFYFFELKDDEDSFSKYKETYENGYRLLTIKDDDIFMVYDGGDYYFYDIVRFDFNREYE